MYIQLRSDIQLGDKGIVPNKICIKYLKLLKFCYKKFKT